MKLKPSPGEQMLQGANTPVPLYGAPHLVDGALCGSGLRRASSRRAALPDPTEGSREDVGEGGDEAVCPHLTGSESHRVARAEDREPAAEPLQQRSQALDLAGRVFDPGDRLRGCQPVEGLQGDLIDGVLRDVIRI